MGKNFFNVCRTNGTAANPCDLSALYLQNEMDCKSDEDFFRQFNFESREEIERAIRMLAQTIISDAYFCKMNRDNNAIVRSCHTRFNAICCSVDKKDKIPISVSGQLWGSTFARKQLNERVTKMFADKPNAMQFKVAEQKIKYIYGLTDKDMRKLHFFIEQVKAGDEFPDSLRRMLYIWGSTKQTGKTTCAKMIVCILNGVSDCNKYTKFTTRLSDELQIGAYKVPKISECNVAMMDECFYADMGKTYADFKRMMTTSNGKARLPYGQEFAWYGHPNYVSTSNESLRRFIKDWNDRRYLAIEFKQKPAENMTFDDIFSMWKSYITNSRPKADFAEWADDISKISNEDGEFQEISNEYALEMRGNKFLSWLKGIPQVGTRSSADGRKSLKFFIDYFAGYDNTARRRRGEIETAVISIFGNKVEGQSFWYLQDLKDIAYAITKNNVTGKNEELPF